MKQNNWDSVKKHLNTNFKDEDYYKRLYNQFIIDPVLNNLYDQREQLLKSTFPIVFVDSETRIVTTKYDKYTADALIKLEEYATLYIESNYPDIKEALHKASI